VKKIINYFIIRNLKWTGELIFEYDYSLRLAVEKSHF